MKVSTLLAAGGAQVNLTRPDDPTPYSQLSSKRTG